MINEEIKKECWNLEEQIISHIEQSKANLVWTSSTSFLYKNNCFEFENYQGTTLLKRVQKEGKDIIISCGKQAKYLLNYLTDSPELLRRNQLQFILQEIKR